MILSTSSPTATDPSQVLPKLPVREKLAYGLGDFASNLIFATLSSFLMFYYTDIFGLSAVAVGTLLFVARAADAVWDLYLGTLVDRTRTRWGQCRPYLVFGAPLLAVCAIATFTVPAGSDGYKLVYAYVTYTLLMVTYSLVNIPYSAMPALMSDDPRDRTTLAAYRMFFAIFATMLVGALTLQLVGFFGGGDADWYGVVLDLCCLHPRACAASASAQRGAPRSQGAGGRPSVVDDGVDGPVRVHRIVNHGGFGFVLLQICGGC